MTLVASHVTSLPRFSLLIRVLQGHLASLKVNGILEFPSEDKVLRLESVHRIVGSQAINRKFNSGVLDWSEFVKHDITLVRA